MSSLRFRLPGRSEALGAVLARLCPELPRASRRRLIEAGRVRVEGRAIDRAGFECPPGAGVEIEADEPLLPPPAPSDSGSSWAAIVDAPPWSSGDLALSGLDALELSVTARRDGLARLRLVGPSLASPVVCAALADAGMPVVGDLERGGLGLAGGPRITALAGEESEPGSPEWPDEPAWPDELATLFVSAETARAIDRGHAWILQDDASDSAGRFRPGTLLRVAERDGRTLGWAHAEGQTRPAARLWARGPLEPDAIDSVDSRVARALARRRALLVDIAQGGTNAFRLIHGECDGLPGLFIDRLGPLLRVLVTGRATDGFRAQVLDALARQLPLTPEGEPWSVLELLHLPTPPRSEFDRVRWLTGGPAELAATGLDVDDAGFRVFERGLEFWVDPGWQTPRRTRPGFGLFLDQRENRDRLAIHAARGGRWLNLFAHTGAFSVSLLAAGAEEVVSVDLSMPYLRRLEANLEANRAAGVDPGRHLSVRSDGRRYLERLEAGRVFDGIVLDPPTAASAGRRFWSLGRDLEPLLRRCVARLAPGGVLLVTQNRAGPPLGLDTLLARLAARARRPIVQLEPAPAGSDHPVLAGFPEGEPFEGWLMRLD